MNTVLLLHAPSDAARAHDVGARLKALGRSVRIEACGAAGPRDRRRLAEAARTSPRVLLLWSRAATHSLRATAMAAPAGKLACARLDAALPPARLGAGAVGLPGGRAQTQTLRRLLESEAKAAPSWRVQTARGAAGHSTALALLLLGVAVGCTAYAVNPGFAAHVNALLSTAQAMAHSIRR
jgi:hypothetical protein